MSLLPHTYVHARHRAAADRTKSRQLRPQRRLAPKAAQLRTQSDALVEEFSVLSDFDVPTMRTCWSCGCTDDQACPGGCAWAVTDEPGEDLCTTCRGAMNTETKQEQR